MITRRAIFRAILLGLVPGLLLASCNSAQDGEYSRQRQPRDSGSGGY